MSFTFGAPKTATGFTLPTTSTTTSNAGFQFAGAAGDAKTAKPAITLTFTPALTSVTTPSITTTVGSTTTPLGFSLTTTTPASSAPQFSLGNLGTTTTGNTSLSFPISTTSAPLLLNVPTPSVTTTTPVTSSGFLSGTGLLKQTTSSTIATSAAVSTTSPGTAAVTATTPSLTSGGANIQTSLTYSQIEDLINKWTIYLEDETKHFTNQAKQMNAWDRLLITNGEKILYLSNGIERVKQLQGQLDQELDFVVAQQKELLDLIEPLEKELTDTPITDMDRHRTYQMAETIDTELKQMSEDLKEIIEHLNESNKYQELANPMHQIGSILNVHMNSLQWIDRQITKITTHLDQISKMHDMNKRNHEINLQRTYE